MSEYFNSLQEPAKARYVQKLNLIGLEEKDDPYSDSNAHTFVENMSVWPEVEYGHIFGYFIRRPGLYTQDELLAWKQLDAYNYFHSGYVRTILVRKINDLCILKAKVNPSQRSPESCLHSWIAVKNDGPVISAHCTCMAGYICCF